LLHTSTWKPEKFSQISNCYKNSTAALSLEELSLCCWEFNKPAGNMHIRFPNSLTDFRIPSVYENTMGDRQLSG
jgi:hypothetical protein